MPVLMPLAIPTTTLYAFIFSPMPHATPIPLSVTIFAEEYKSLCFSECSFLHHPVTLSLLGPHVFFAPYSLTPSAYEILHFLTCTNYDFNKVIPPLCI